MELIENLSNYLKDLVESVREENCELESLLRRGKVIAECEWLRKHLSGITDYLDSNLQQLSSLQASEIARAEDILGKLSSGENPSSGPASDCSNGDARWTVVRARKYRAREQNTAKRKIQIALTLGLNAIPVDSFDQVKQDGELYFVTRADHFAFRLAGHLFHGNIGTIYTDEKNPVKIKNCKFAGDCVKGTRCDYYHDPTTYIGSRDHRNFIASSWLYSPSRGRARGRRFGSHDKLCEDIIGLSTEEVERFYDQSMHDILCALLLKTNYSKDGESTLRGHEQRGPHS